ncbi:MAG TPA: circularly permuted type 2 ATP-grasp protein [Propionibacteriaceae bacterium]
MTVLGRYLASAQQFDLLEPRRGFDEFVAPDGTVRSGWASVVDGLDEFAETDLLHASREVARLLEDDNVTYTPSPTSTVSIADPAGTTPALLPVTEPKPWRLDPMPLVLDDREWASLEAGVVQRAELLDAIMSDLYGARKLLSRQQLPPMAVLDHEEYLRAVVGTETVANQRLFMVAADLGRDPSGQWKVMADRTQAPSGAGFAMQNRRVISRVLPEIYHQAHLHRLTPFFQAMRLALVDAAPPHVEDPRVVVLSPGTHSETAFDQAFVASLLGFPLLEGSDLTVRDGRVWLRGIGKLEQVDVILRRVDSNWMDALELRGGSRLGVTGLLECVRQGTVSVVNNLGSGILENPALLPYLPELSERLLGSPLRLPSVDTWWCGDPASLSHVLTHLETLVVRPISRGAGRGVVGSALSAEQREGLAAKIKAAPHRFVGQEVLQLSSAPTSQHDQLVRRDVVLRSFAVRSGTSYTAMLGGLARVYNESDLDKGPLVTAPDGGLAKDVWVVSSEPVVAARMVAPRLDDDRSLFAPGAAPAAMVPRVLSDLFWFGRYAERAEDLLRLVLAARNVAIETDLDVTNSRALETLLRAVTHVSTAYPGFTRSGVAMMPEFRAMLLDRHRFGTAAQSIGQLSMAAQGVRDQLSEDVWIVLADMDRALAALAANAYDQGLQLTDASERVLTGLLALAGIISENMVRDPGWYMLDSGRGLERALQVAALLRVTLCKPRSSDDRLVIEAVLTASESIVTFRRRYRGRAGTDAVIELLVLDQHNPRSIAYQLARIQTDLRAIPGTSPTARPLRLLDSLLERVRTADPAELAETMNGERPLLWGFLGGLQDQLRDLSLAIRDQFQQQPPPQQPLWRAGAVESGSPGGEA